MRLIAIGDISLNGYYHTLLARDRFDPLGQVENWRPSDLIIGNLESPITSAPRVAPSKCTLRGSPEARRVFESHHLRVVSLANNHMMDFGSRGLLATQRYLNQCGVRHCGAGANLQEARSLLILEHEGMRIGFLAFCDVEQKSPLYAEECVAGVAPWCGHESLEQIRNAKLEIDWLVVFFHWGVEMAQLPTVEQCDLGRNILDAGADLILGSHPHVLQPFEQRNGGLIAYSLGNFLFSPMYWRGINPTNGDRFCSKLRLHPLSRRTGWLEVELGEHRPLGWKFNAARLSRSLDIKPGWPSRWWKDWDDLGQKMGSEDFAVHSEEETLLGRQRTFLRWNGKSIMRRIEMKLFDYGFIGRGWDTQ